MSYAMMVLTMDYLLRIQLIYKLVSFLFFRLQKSLFSRKDSIKQYVDKHYSELKYELKASEDEELVYRVDNIFYRSNVWMKQKINKIIY